MSYLNFMIFGLGGSQEAHLRTSFDKDVVKVFGRKGNLEGRTTKEIETKPLTQPVGADVEENAEKKEELSKREVEIDGVVRVTTVADEVRKDEKGFWNHQWKAHKGTFVATLLGGIAAIIGAVVLGTQPHFWGLAVAVGVVGLALLGIALLTYRRSNQADEQKNSWKDPAKRIAKERGHVGKAGSSGFDHAYNAKMKGRSLADKEVETLWEGKMSAYQTSFKEKMTSLQVNGVQPKENKAETESESSPENNPENSPLNVAKKEAEIWVREFLDAQLLGQEKVDYAFGESVSRNVKKAQEGFKQLQANYQNGQGRVEERKQALEKEKGELLQVNTNDLQQQLAQHDGLQVEIAAIEEGLRNAQRDLDLVRRNGSPTLVDHGGRVIPGQGQGRSQEIERLERDINHLRDLITEKKQEYDTIVRPIHKRHALNLARIEENTKQRLQALENNESEQLLDLLPEISRLLSAFEGTDFRASFSTPGYMSTGAHPAGENLYPQLDPSDLYSTSFSPPFAHPSAPPLDDDERAPNPYNPFNLQPTYSPNPFGPFPYQNSAQAGSQGSSQGSTQGGSTGYQSTSPGNPF